MARGDPQASDASAWLRRGHALEAEGTPESLAHAVQAYDVVIALLRSLPLASNDAVRRDLGGAWMNRGNALQKQATPESLAAAVAAYDEAISILRLLPIDAYPPHRNCLGSAWMNRGHALLQFGSHERLAAAISSHEAAVDLLRALPVVEVPGYRLNLAGGEINLANALLLSGDSAAAERARTLALAALELVASEESGASEFADLGLKARRAQCEALGQLLFAQSSDAAAVAFAHEASEAVDSGLTLARRWERRDVPHFRILAERLFRFGAQLYQLHQPHFLAEFLLENLDPATAPAAWCADAQFREIASSAIAGARARLQPSRLLTADDPASERALAIHQSLADAAARLARLPS